jgi:hypothetical protein
MLFTTAALYKKYDMLVPKISNSIRSRLRASLIFLSCIFIVLVRYPSYILQPRVWAEESIYFEIFVSAEKWMTGFDAIIYPAYYVLASRIIGFFASLSSIENIALITTISGTIVLCIPLFIINFTNSKHWDSYSKKIILSIFLVFTCSTGEIWMNSTNVGFIFAISSFLILVDEKYGGIIKQIFYILLILLGALSGPISLLMAPFFFIRLLEKKESHVFAYCIAFFVSGIIQITYFYIATNIGEGIANPNRGLYMDSSFKTQFIYWISPNIIFPLFGYFIATAFRSISIMIENDIQFLLNLELLSSQFGVLLIRFFSLAINYIYIPLLILITFLTYYFFKTSDRFSKIYLISLFFYLSIILTILSLGGHGGYRYSYICSFILMFFLLLRFNSSYGAEKKILRIALTSSIFFGVIEYYPRVISFTPDFAYSYNEKWPLWKEEVAIWRTDENYKVKIWPYLRSDSGIWPERKAVWTVNLSDHENWNKAGNKKFSEELIILMSDNKP